MNGQWPARHVMSPPGDVAYLGTMLELEHVGRRGARLRHRWSPDDAPALYWSPSQRALYALADLSVSPAASRLPSRESTRAFSTWTGRRPTSVHRVEVPRYVVERAGQAGHIIYRSHKWGAWQNYIHTFEDGTFVEQGEGSPPPVFVVRGPPLRLTEAGLVD